MKSEATQSKQRCDQCGRSGVRGFKTYDNDTTRRLGIPPITVCANSNACRKRWPKNPEWLLDG